MLNPLPSANSGRPEHLLAGSYSFQQERNERILQSVERCQTPEQLRNFIFNAHMRRAPDIRNAAFRKLACVSRISENDDIENAVKQLIAIYHTRLTKSRCYKLKSEKYEDMLRLSGAVETLLDMRKHARFIDVSQFLVELDLADLTLESVIVRFSDHFEAKIVNTSKRRLKTYRSLLV